MAWFLLGGASYPPGNLLMHIGPYQILKIIGRGGMGVVFKALNPQDGKIVAIKMIDGTRAFDLHGRMQLVREASTTAQLRHPNIVSVRDIGQENGQLYIVMEYLEGCSLDRIIKFRPKVPVEAPLRLMLEICSGLAFAHGQGIIHRDIKPSNVFMEKSGQVKIVDFGLAKINEITSGCATRDSKTNIVGTWSYMSPEQLNGLTLDYRTDIWSAGVTFYEILTYRRPFAATNLLSLTKAIESAPFPPLENSMPHSSEITSLLERALAKNLNERYQSMELFYHDLVGLLRSVTQLAIPTTEAPSGGGVPNRNIHPVYGFYTQPGFDPGYQSSSKVRFQPRKFTSSGFLERIKQKTKAPGSIALLLPGYLFFATLVWLSGWHQRHSIDRFSLQVSSVIYLSVLAASAFFSILWIRRNTTEPRRCRTCKRRRMTRTSKQTRYVTSKSEINWGYNDCIAALKDGCYKDAVKLLSVHGTENPKDYSVFRFNLEFWECPKCGDQAALMIVEEKIDQKWMRQDAYQESYKYAEWKPMHSQQTGLRQSVPSDELSPEGIISGAGIRCPLCQRQPGKEVLWHCICGHQWNTFSTGGKCPACSHNWQNTACPSCGGISPHLSWYREGRKN